MPFGTGRAVSEQSLGKPALTYPFEAFEDLKQFFADMHHPPKAMRPFLEAMEHKEKLREICANTASQAAFRDRFFRWFNGFVTMKWIHFARDNFYGARPVLDEARRLPGMGDSKDLLATYRHLQRTQICRINKGKS